MDLKLQAQRQSHVRIAEVEITHFADPLKAITQRLGVHVQDTVDTFDSGVLATGT